jgi:deoxyribodipyrimidine photo-lyase
MRDWAARHGLKQVVTGEAPVGPEADRLAVLGGALARDGVRLVRLRRRWDDLAWPMASRGFFAFKAGIPKLLAG